MLRSAAVALLLFPLAAQAEPLTAHYNAYAAGLHVMTLQAQLDLADPRYRMQVAFHTTGAYSLFVHSHVETTVQGSFAAGRSVPQRYVSSGVLKGVSRAVDIEFRDGQPVVRQITPKNETERDPVPADQQRGTIDTLSAMAQLIDQVNHSGRCDGAVRTFDGSRLAQLRAWTVGQEDLSPTSRSTFAGKALHCEFEGRQLAGFELDEDRERQQQPHRGAAWFAALTPGGPLLPVKVAFHTKWFGDATMYITAPE